jgi:hypothetical protein
MKQPRDTNEKWGLTIPQRQEQCPQSPWEVASMLTIAMGLHRHGTTMRRRANVLPHCQLHPCHIEKEKMRLKNHLKLYFVNQKQRRGIRIKYFLQILKIRLRIGLFYLG